MSIAPSHNSLLLWAHVESEVREGVFSQINRRKAATHKLPAVQHMLLKMSVSNDSTTFQIIFPTILQFNNKTVFANNLEFLCNQ